MGGGQRNKDPLTEATTALKKFIDLGKKKREESSWTWVKRREFIDLGNSMIHKKGI